MQSCIRALVQDVLNMCAARFQLLHSVLSANQDNFVLFKQLCFLCAETT